MLPDKYKKLKELGEEAMPGPWRTAKCHSKKVLAVECEIDDLLVTDGIHIETAEFIAEARNQIDSLLEDLETACEALEYYSQDEGGFEGYYQRARAALEKIRSRQETPSTDVRGVK